ATERIPVPWAPDSDTATPTATGPAGTRIRTTVSALLRGTSSAPNATAQPAQSTTRTTAVTAVLRDSSAEPTGPAAVNASTTQSRRAGWMPRRSSGDTARDLPIDPANGYSSGTGDDRTGKNRWPTAQ